MLHRIKVCYVDNDAVARINKAAMRDEIIDTMAYNSMYSLERFDEKLTMFLKRYENRPSFQTRDFTILLCFLASVFLLSLILGAAEILILVGCILTIILYLWLWFSDKLNFKNEVRGHILQACKEYSFDVALNYCYLEQIEGAQKRFNQMNSVSCKLFTIREKLNGELDAFRIHVRKEAYGKINLNEIINTHVYDYQKNLFDNFKKLEDIEEFHLLIFKKIERKTWFTK